MKKKEFLHDLCDYGQRLGHRELKRGDFCVKICGANTQKTRSFSDSVQGLVTRSMLSWHTSINYVAV